MRIRINFTANTSIVPFNNQQLVNSYIHKCLGHNNQYHDARNDSSISGLQGGKKVDATGLSFSNGSFITVTSNDAVFLNTLLIGLMNNPEFTHGMKFNGVTHITESFINGWNHFATLSPFVIKEYVDKKTYHFLTLDDDDFSSKLKAYLVNKLTKINPKLDLTDFEVNVPSHASHKVKRILVKNTINLANQCHVSIHCKKNVAELLYTIGLGQSTGSGFGTIYKTENTRLYR